MSKLTLAIATMSLAGCASMGEWRTLTIDGGSEAAFGDSLSRLNNELPYSRSRMLALALVDITNIGVQMAGETNDGSPAYTEESLRSDLDGLTYEGVIALADQSGPSIKRLYYSRGWGEAQREANRLLTAGDNPLGPTRPPPLSYSFDAGGNINIEWPSQ
jgi:hypothetical protein